MPKHVSVKDKGLTIHRRTTRALTDPKSLNASMLLRWSVFCVGERGLMNGESSSGDVCNVLGGDERE